MRDIYFIRHGKPEHPMKNGKELMYGKEATLSKEGRKQIEWLGQKLPRFEVIYTSDFVRARETAEILSTSKTEIIEDKRLGDILAQNAIGQPFTDVLVGKIRSHEDDETIEMMEQRVTEAFKQIFSSQKKFPIAIVGHGHQARITIYRFVEKMTGSLPVPFTVLEGYNYLNLGEAFAVSFDEKGNVMNRQIITQPETVVPGKRQR